MDLWLTKSHKTPTANSTSRTTQSSRSSKATASASTSGPPRKLVLDAAAKKYGKIIEWKEVLAGQKAFDETGEWLPEQTVTDFRDYLIGIKGPLTTPIGGGFRSLNVALRQILDLYVCLRPVRWFQGVPSPVKHPELVDMVIFRENTEDVYAGLEVEAGIARAPRSCARFLKESFGWDIREMSGLGVKPISKSGSERLIRAALVYALKHQRESVTLVHKGNIQKFTEGAFMKWGYQLVKDEFNDVAVGWDDCNGKPGDKLLVKDVIADIAFQQSLTAPDGVRRHRDDEPERRLPLGRPRGPGRRHRHRAGREHQLRDRSRDLRGDARHRAQVRRAWTRSTPARCCSRAC